MVALTMGAGRLSRQSDQGLTAGLCDGARIGAHVLWDQGLMDQRQPRDQSISIDHFISSTNQANRTYENIPFLECETLMLAGPSHIARHFGSHHGFVRSPCGPSDGPQGYPGRPARQPLGVLKHASIPLSSTEAGMAMPVVDVVVVSKAGLDAKRHLACALRLRAASRLL
jgi:hypothetical protein